MLLPTLNYLPYLTVVVIDVFCSHGQKEAKRQFKMLQERLESVKTELTDKAVHQSELELQTRHAHSVIGFHIAPRNFYSAAILTHTAPISC